MYFFKLKFIDRKLRKNYSFDSKKQCIYTATFPCLLLFLFVVILLKFDFLKDFRKHKLLQVALYQVQMFHTNWVI